MYRSNYKYTDDTDLWFAMRGAGSSYGDFFLLLYVVERNTWYLLSLLFYLTLDPFQGL